MRLLHTPSKIDIGFDEPNLLTAAGLVPVMGLAERVGLPDLVAEHLRLPAAVGDAGANVAAKVGSLVAGMAAGADCLDDLHLLRAGALGEVLGGIRAPSTLGTFLRKLTIGSIAQLGKIHRLLLVRTVAAVPALLTGLDTLAILDLDTTQRRVYGPAKQGAKFGHTKIASKSVFVRGLNAMIGTVSTLTSPPLVANARLRAGNKVSVTGADRFLAETVTTARAAGATGAILARLDSGFYAGTVVTTARRLAVHFSITTPQNAAIRAACEAIPASAFTPIRYPKAVWDETLGEWISDAEIAETGYTAFKGTRHQVTARLVVRRVKARNPTATRGQGELFPVWRYHAVLTDSPSAPRGASLYPRHSREELEGRFLGLMAYLGPKGVGGQ